MRVMKGLLGLLLAMPLLASAEEIGQVSTVFKFVGPNDRIVVEAFDDPKVDGVTCYLQGGRVIRDAGDATGVRCRAADSDSVDSKVDGGSRDCRTAGGPR